jgi:hypothetical protein
LRTWGEGLLNDGRDEVRAAGRAILLLIDEVELLNVDLWHARRLGAAEGEAGASAGEPSGEADAVAEEPSDQLGAALRSRLGAFRYRPRFPPAQR